MEISPNLNTGERRFIETEQSDSTSLASIQDIESLTSEQRKRRDDVIDAAFNRVEDK